MAKQNYPRRPHQLATFVLEILSFPPLTPALDVAGLYSHGVPRVLDKARMQQSRYNKLHLCSRALGYLASKVKIEV